jgi:hypothetical protein
MFVSIVLSGSAENNAVRAPSLVRATTAWWNRMAEGKRGTRELLKVY